MGRRKKAPGGRKQNAKPQSPLVLRALNKRQELVRRARRDVNAFIEYTQDRPEKYHDSSGLLRERQVPARQGAVHREWHRLADEHDRLIIVAPRGHWKTGQMVIARSMFTLGQNADSVVKIVCQSDAKATKRLTAIRDNLKNNKRIHQVFPHLRPARELELDWNKHMVTVRRKLRSPDPSIEALGITSSASGDRATHIFADDVVDRRNAITLPKVRESIKKSWDDWVNLLLPGGRILYICTLWHNADLTHDLLASDSWAVAWYEITMPGMGSLAKLPDGTIRESTRSLWGWEASCLRHPEDPEPEDMSTDMSPTSSDLLPGVIIPETPSVVAASANDTGPKDIAQLAHAVATKVASRRTRPVKQRPCSCGPWSAPALRRREKELSHTPGAFLRGFGNRPMADTDRKIDPEWIHFWTVPPPKDAARIMAIDTASSTSARADWTGWVILSIDAERGRVCVDEARHAKLTFPDRVRATVELWEEHRPEWIVVELADEGRALAEWLLKHTHIPVRGVTPRGSKAARLVPHTPYLKSAAVQFNPLLDPELPLEEGRLASEKRGDIVTELVDFGFHKTRDLADAWAHGMRFAVVTYPAWTLAGSESITRALIGPGKKSGPQPQRTSIVLV